MKMYTWKNYHFKAYTRIGAYIKAKRHAYSKALTTQIVRFHNCFSRGKHYTAQSVEVKTALKNLRKTCKFANIQKLPPLEYFYAFNPTGEVIQRKTRRQAYKYFKADGKKWGYAVRYRDIVKCS